MTFRPDPKAFAEVCYVLPGGEMWRAVVYRNADGWELKLGRTQKTDGFFPGGIFSNGKALVKFIREKVEKRVEPNIEPVYDTLHKLLTSSPMSVVPDCYEPSLATVMSYKDDSSSDGRSLLSCHTCPYRSTCGEPVAQPEILPAEKVVEPEGVFMQRLRSKIRNIYGEGDE